MAGEIRPASAMDRVLAALDVGTQATTGKSRGYPAGTTAETLGYADDPTRCARCQHHPIDDGDMCGGCRAFLLGDTDTDPMHPRGWDVPVRATVRYASRDERGFAPGAVVPRGIVYDEVRTYREAGEAIAAAMGDVGGAAAMYAEAVAAVVAAAYSELEAAARECASVIESYRAYGTPEERRKEQDRERSRAAVADYRRAQRRRGWTPR